jgi:SAM-dependent methyltransferase
MLDLFLDRLEPARETLILDVGVTPDTSLPDSNFLEQLYPYPESVTASSVENISNLIGKFPGVGFVQTEKFALPFKTNAFDIVFCSAVLEHVGDRPSQARFIKELLRVSKKFFITTPNKNFPIEVHTFLPLLHWLPQNLHQSILRRLGHDFWAETENLNLLSSKSLRQLFNNQEKLTIEGHYLLGMCSNLIAYGDSD